MICRLKERGGMRGREKGDKTKRQNYGYTLDEVKMSL